MIKAFHQRFPNCQAEYGAVEDSDFFGRTFDGVLGSGEYRRILAAEHLELAGEKRTRETTTITSLRSNDILDIEMGTNGILVELAQN